MKNKEILHILHLRKEIDKKSLPPEDKYNINDYVGKETSLYALYKDVLLKYPLIERICSYDIDSIEVEAVLDYINLIDQKVEKPKLADLNTVLEK